MSPETRRNGSRWLVAFKRKQIAAADLRQRGNTPLQICRSKTQVKRCYETVKQTPPEPTKEILIWVCTGQVQAKAAGVGCKMHAYYWLEFSSNHPYFQQIERQMRTRGVWAICCSTAPWKPASTNCYESEATQPSLCSELAPLNY